MVLNIRKRLPFIQQLFWDTEGKGSQSKLSKTRRKASMHLKTSCKDWNRKGEVCKGVRVKRGILGCRHPSTAPVSLGSRGTIAALLQSSASLEKCRAVSSFPQQNQQYLPTPSLSDVQMPCHLCAAGGEWAAPKINQAARCIKRKPNRGNSNGGWRIC